MFRRGEWYSCIGLEHWYVAEQTDDISGEDPSQGSTNGSINDDDREDATRMINLKVNSNGFLSMAWGTTLGQKMFGYVNVTTDLKRSRSSKHRWSPLALQCYLEVRI